MAPGVGSGDDDVDVWGGAGGLSVCERSVASVSLSRTGPL